MLPELVSGGGIPGARKGAGCLKFKQKIPEHESLIKTAGICWSSSVLFGLNIIFFSGFLPYFHDGLPLSSLLPKTSTFFVKISRLRSLPRIILEPVSANLCLSNPLPDTIGSEDNEKERRKG